MHGDPQRDWLDEMLAQQPSWDPPAGFVARLATLAARIEPVAPERFGWASYAADLAHGLRTRIGLPVMAWFEGVVWIARQYWAVLQR